MGEPGTKAELQRKGLEAQASTARHSILKYHYHLGEHLGEHE